MAVKKFSTPGVYRQEIDQSESVSPAGTSTGAIVIRSVKGPINRPVLVQSEGDLYSMFGKPVFTSGAAAALTTANPALTASIIAGIPDNGYGTYQAIEFLKESQNLYVSRAVDSSDKFSARYFDVSDYDYTTSAIANTSASSNGIAVQPYIAGNQFDRSDYNSTIETSAGFQGNMDFVVASLYPGDEGNNIAVSMETYTSACDWVYKYDGFPVSGIATLSPTTQVIASKVVRIDVYVKETSQSWSSIQYDVQQKQLSAATSAYSLRDLYPPVETFYCSLTPLTDSENRQLQAATVINGNSNYIYVKTSSSVSVPKNTGVTTILKHYDLLALGGGAVKSLATGLGDEDLTAVLAAWSVFQSREFIPNINILCNCDWNTSVKQRVAQIAATRMDCLATGQAGDPSNLTVASILSQEAYGYTNPSYMALYAGYEKVYDANNDKYFYIPEAAFAGALYARTDNVANTWEAPAGQARGMIPSIGKKVVFTMAQIGQLYDRNINTSTTQPGLGTYMLGQKTAQMKASFLSRVNVRRDLLYIENSIEPMLNAFLFELNNDRTRQRVTANVDSFLSDLQAAGGLVNKSVICDSSNNGPEIINNNQMIVSIYVQPPTVTEFIQLQVIIQKSGATITRV
jgi:phage tail sheath protein FI